MLSGIGRLICKSHYSNVEMHPERPVRVFFDCSDAALNGCLFAKTWTRHRSLAKVTVNVYIIYCMNFQCQQLPCNLSKNQGQLTCTGVETVLIAMEDCIPS